MIFAFAGMVAFNNNREWRAQRFQAIFKDAEERRRRISLVDNGPDEGLVGI